MSQGQAQTQPHLAQRIAYACGNFGQSAFYNALSTYFVIYVTEALFANVDKGKAAGLIALITGLVVVIRIAEIFIDPLLGNLVDNTTTKFGRFRPWQFLGGLVSALLLVMVFTGLFGLVNVNQTWFIVLFVITFIVLDVFYSLRDISYWGMIPAISEDSHERSVYTALGTFTGSIGYNGLTVVVVPIVTAFTYMFTGRHEQGQAGWTAFAVIVALLGILTAWTVAFGTKENESALRSKAQKAGGPLQAFKAIAQNDQLLWVALSYLCYAIANVATTGVLFYLFKFVLGLPNSYSIAGVVPVVVGLIMSPLYPIVNRRVPRRYLFLGGMALVVVSYLVFLLSASTKSLPLVVAALVLYYVPQTFIQMTVILGLTDSIEYGQLKNGRRNEAVTLSVRPMLDKIAGAVSNGLVGFIAVSAGMTGHATAADMTAGNIATFKTFAFYIPMALIVLGFLVYFFTVKISEKMHAEIVKQLEVKLARENGASSEESASVRGAGAVQVADGVQTPDAAAQAARVVAEASEVTGIADAA
ncbi:MFS transporter [Bifidobacterium sp. MA2]|uniref:MFS transporter n=1 Tax=Bifidobacterium santillanense TaxID=2809028 RepID=A0ABS5UNB1_9BIFI|nr:glycoside-pentoside-hexuronide (GPH):cation symporter [Bifidobacterium santillanense]MBT1172369.1 MFS transporter [Bifidobacterium santillanense]